MLSWKERKENEWTAEAQARDVFLTSRLCFRGGELANSHPEHEAQSQFQCIYPLSRPNWASIGLNWVSTMTDAPYSVRRDWQRTLRHSKQSLRASALCKAEAQY